MKFLTEPLFSPKILIYNVTTMGHGGDGTQWCRGMFWALQPEGRWFKSTPGHCVATLDK